VTIIDRTLLPGQIRPVLTLPVIMMCAILGGCAGLPAHYDAGAAPRAYGPLSQQALADEIYLDGTGPATGSSSRRPARAARVPARSAVETAQIAPIPQSDVLSSAAATTPRPAAQGEADKADTGDWLEREKAADARLRDKLRICRGC